MVIGFFARGAVLPQRLLILQISQLPLFAGFLTASFFPLAVLPLAFFEATLATATFARQKWMTLSFHFSISWFPQPQQTCAQAHLSPVPAAFPFIETKHKFCKPVQEVKVVR